MVILPLTSNTERPFLSHLIFLFPCAPVTCSVQAHICKMSSDKPSKNLHSATAKGRVALITGVTGQTGSFLADILLEKRYEVHGITRGSPSDIPVRLAHILSGDNPLCHRFTLHHCDILDIQAFSEILISTKPDELYNLAAQSSVGLSFRQPHETLRVDGLGVLNVLETVRLFLPKVRVFQASSSEIFGRALTSPQTEHTKPYPCSPYANAKLVAHSLARMYREAYDMHVCSGILYNHESSRRGGAFVTQKIVQAAVRISLGLQRTVALGNLDSGRDWGHAKDFADCIWRMLQTPVADDYIVATGVSHTVREFAAKAFAAVGIFVEFSGSGLTEVGLNKKDGKVVVEVDARFFRPAEPNQIIGDAKKACLKLGWKPSYSVDDLIKEMVKAYREQIVSHAASNAFP